MNKQWDSNEQGVRSAVLGTLRRPQTLYINKQWDSNEQGVRSAVLGTLRRSQTH